MRCGRERRTAAHAAAELLIVGIIGAGAIGTLLGATLAPHADVRVLFRENRTARGVASRGGLVLDGAPPQRVAAAAGVDGLQGVEIVIVAVKAYATIAALGPLRGTAVAGVPFVAFQNGLDSVEHIEYALGRHGGIALAPTTEAAMRVADGSAVRMGRGSTRIGWARGHDGDARVLDELIAALSLALAIERVEAVEPYVWGKLVANAAINPLTALAGVRNGEIVARADLRERAARIALEVASVARREGVELPFGDPVAFVEDVALITASNRSSMLEDIEAGRPTEIEAIVGAVVRRAAALGVPVPENERVLYEVRARLKA
jgi:2-dehydropantoate 2-reductase